MKTKNRICSFLGSIKNLNNNTVKDNFYHAQKAMKWLCLAQDISCDGGISAGFHLIRGWHLSYPETTGYIIPTFFNYAKWSNEEIYINRALKMADWLIDIQNKDGSISGGQLGDNLNALVFDTGQVIFGLVRAYEETNKSKYIDAAIKSGNWLADVQEGNGSWVKFSYNRIPHTYHSRVAWALLELHRITQNESFLRTALKNINWTLANGKENGWFENCGFTIVNNKSPYTHTIAYTIRGILEAGLYLNNSGYISRAKASADAIFNVFNENGYSCGDLNKNLKNKNRYTCLTGNAQMAIIYFKLYGEVNDKRYMIVAQKIIRYLKKRQAVSKISKNIDGAISGSYPIWGKYLHYFYPNWANKFFVDAIILNDKIENRLDTGQKI